MRSIHLAAIGLAIAVSGAVCSAQATTTAPPAPNAANPPAAVTPARHHSHYRELFRGVQLTADQQSKIRASHAQHRTEARTLHQQMGSARVTLRSAKESKDTAALATARANMHTIRSQFVSMRSQWMAETRAVLTPSQQAQFDANAAALKARHQDRRSSDGGRTRWSAVG